MFDTADLTGLDNIGERLDHYRIDGLIVRSAMAAFFYATDLHTHRRVIIKLPRPEMDTDPTFTERFLREERFGEQLDHPGLIKVIPAHDRSRSYIVMEWSDGTPLSRILSGGKLAPERAVRIAVAICAVLEYVRGRGIGQWDLRPEGILVDAEDHVKLIDFGGAPKTGARRLTLTRVSQMSGMSEYVSPEELKGKRGDARSDLYVLGIILYEMVTGQKPFSESDPFDRILNYPVPPREIDPAISPQLQEVIYRALEREPRNRYANAYDFARDLEHLDQVGVAERAEITDWRKRRSAQSKWILLYVALALIPIVIFAVLFYFARR